ncbi:MAG: class I tRNA ligase family protein, partial [Verrucomicrobiota bacterium]
HVDFEFGTGVLKVTPAHDKADFDIGTRHKLPLIEVINADGSMNPLAGGPLAGLDRFRARKVAVELLKEQAVLVEEKPYENNVGFSQRADVPIEPRLSEQWFLKYPAVEQSKACVASGRMKFHPDRWAKVYDHWLANIQDWCISRQLWWGHQIPVWSIFKEYGADDAETDKAAASISTFLRQLRQSERPDVLVKEVGSIRVSPDPATGKKVIGGQVCVGPGNDETVRELESLGFTQDPDVLDTWFSSWLWPFATMGWPEQTETLKKFYPTTDLVTGPDIIFFWVARMIMAGYEFMGEPQYGLADAMPFQNVYFTGIIRDKQGRKMSKTLGNSPDPLELISKYGADALRFGTMRSAPLGQDVLFDEKDVELGRNFCNKLWNACRFRQMQGGEVQGEINRMLLMPDDKWILLKLDAVIREVTIALNEYKFSEATTALYRFFWSEYCDWYVEASKAVFFGSDAPRKANTVAVIDFVLSNTLKMFHPFLPFITEELWHGMGYSADMPEDQGGKTIMNAPWPLPLNVDEKGELGLDDCYLEMTDTKYDLVKQGRDLRRAANIQAAKKVKYVFKPAQHLIPHDAEVIKLLLNAESLEINPDYQPPRGTPSVNAQLGELFLPLEGHIDRDAEIARLTKEKEKATIDITTVQQKLENPNFTQKVPASVLQEHQQRLVEWQNKLAHIQAALDALQG